jgi:hypothetical protein
MLTVKIIDRTAKILKETCGEKFVDFVYTKRYHTGSAIRLEYIGAENGSSRFLVIQLDETMPPAQIYMKGQVYDFPIPFFEKKFPYSPKAFSGKFHHIKVREAYAWEISAKKNLCFNPYDTHENQTCFPHAQANTETRGSSMFCAQNAINGNTLNSRHGSWPYESWGINRDPDAEIIVEFGRMVVIDRVVLWTRADFPHDSWWRQGELEFSDGTSQVIQMRKTDLPHEFDIEPKTVRWIKLSKLIKDEDDHSPFPALTQIEGFGYECGMEPEI